MSKIEKINAILYSKWDPLGVGGLAPADEYLCYASWLVEKFDRSTNINSVVTLLSKWRSEELCVPQNIALDEKVAKKLSRILAE